jgi:hypothetical protein
VTFAQLKQELSDRGFAHLTDARQGVYVNAARAELDRLVLWPWRQTSASGAAPLVVSDLGPIESVQNTSQSSVPLFPAQRGWLSDTFGDLTIAGTPSYYYVDWVSGTPTVTTYPSSTNTLAVRYWKRMPDLVNASDVPGAPSEAHYTIVDLAVRRAYHDAGDDSSAAAIQPEIDNAIQQLLISYPPGQADGPDAYVGVGLASVDW